MRSFFLLFLVFFFCACEKDEPFVPTKEDLEWPEYTLADDVEPKVVDVPERDQWETAELPLTVEGEDNGDQSLLYSLTLAHHFLIKNQGAEADYMYEWLADKDEVLDTSSRLQMHAVAWSQVLLYRFVEQEAFLLAAYRVAKKYVGDLRVETLDDGETEIQSLNGSLNSTAFFFFLLVELEDVMQQGEFEAQIAGMANYFENQVGEEGCVFESFPHKETCVPGLNEDGLLDFNAFAVGQSLVAMERLYRYTGEEKWLDLIERAGLFYHEANDGNPNPRGGLYWTAWAGPPLTSLVLERPNETLEGWIFAQADRLVKDQYTPGDEESRVGGFKKGSGRSDLERRERRRGNC